jgi:hypothetical protein
MPAKRHWESILIREIDGVRLGKGPHLIIGSSDSDMCNALAWLSELACSCERHRFLPRFGHDEHYRWIEKRMKAMWKEKGQWFVATMNPIAMDYFYFRTAVEVRRRIFLVRPMSSHHGMLYAMTPDQAEDFYASYKVGFQQVSELLRVKGIW